MDRFEALEIFLKVAQHKSFSRAAESLYLQRSTVSMRIKSLETRLNVRLFHRTTRQVELTSEGLVFYQHARDLLENLEDVENLFSDHTRRISGRLRVDMSSALAEHVVIPKLYAFGQAYPDLSVELSSADRHLDLIHEGIDCAIRAGMGSESGLRSQCIGEMPLVNCVSPEYIKRFGEIQSLEDLSQHYLVAYVQHFAASPEGFEYFDGQSYQEIKMKHLIVVNRIGAYKSACLSGLGLCQIPVTGVHRELRAGTLLSVLAEYQAQPLPLRWVFPYPQSIPHRVQVFMRWFEPLLKQHLQAHLQAE